MDYPLQPNNEFQISESIRLQGQSQPQMPFAFSLTPLAPKPSYWLYDTAAVQRESPIYEPVAA
jgi:hypothetical protein